VFTSAITAILICVLVSPTSVPGAADDAPVAAALALAGADAAEAPVDADEPLPGDEQPTAASSTTIAAPASQDRLLATTSDHPPCSSRFHAVFLRGAYKSGLAGLKHSCLIMSTIGSTARLRPNDDIKPLTVN
jgi:hypothetical protein